MHNICMALHRSVQRDFLKSQSVVKKRRKKKMIKMSIRISLVILLFVSFGFLQCSESSGMVVFFYDLTSCCMQQAIAVKSRDICETILREQY